MFVTSLSLLLYDIYPERPRSERLTQAERLRSVTIRVISHITILNPGRSTVNLNQLASRIERLKPQPTRPHSPLLLLFQQDDLRSLLRGAPPLSPPRWRRHERHEGYVVRSRRPQVRHGRLGVYPRLSPGRGLHDGPRPRAEIRLHVQGRPHGPGRGRLPRRVRRRRRRSRRRPRRHERRPPRQELRRRGPHVRFHECGRRGVSHRSRRHRHGECDGVHPRGGVPPRGRPAGGAGRRSRGEPSWGPRVGGTRCGTAADDGGAAGPAQPPGKQ